MILPVRDRVIWLICGGREFKDSLLLYETLDRLCRERGRPDLIVHGDARGADRMAGQWARERNIKVEAVSADWNRYGKKAGPIRNQKMLDLYCPDLIIAFPGGSGTNNMILISPMDRVVKIDGKS